MPVDSTDGGIARLRGSAGRGTMAFFTFGMSHEVCMALGQTRNACPPAAVPWVANNIPSVWKQPARSFFDDPRSCRRATTRPTWRRRLCPAQRGAMQPYARCVGRGRNLGEATPMRCLCRAGCHTGGGWRGLNGRAARQVGACAGLIGPHLRREPSLVLSATRSTLLLAEACRRGAVCTYQAVCAWRRDYTRSHGY